MVTLLGAAGLLIALAVGVPLLAYGMSTLLDRGNWRHRDGNDGDERHGGLPASRGPGPSGPSAPMTRSAGSDEQDGTVS